VGDICVGDICVGDVEGSTPSIAFLEDQVSANSSWINRSIIINTKPINAKCAYKLKITHAR